MSQRVAEEFSQYRTTLCRPGEPQGQSPRLADAHRPIARGECAPGGSPNLTGIPVTGTLPLNGTFNATANITSFALQNGQLVANCTLTGTLLKRSVVIGNVTNVPITLPVNLPEHRRRVSDPRSAHSGLWI